MIPYINLHNHKHCSDSDVKSIQNVFLDKIEDTDDLPDEICSVGLHPWHIAKLKEQEIEPLMALLKDCMKKEQVLAIGETGLDKLIDTPLEVQMKLFEAQANIAEKAEKPLLVHSVKTYNEVLRLKMDKHYDAPWIIHGFRGNAHLAMQLLRHGFYLSFGKGIEHLEETLKMTDLSKMFIETDDDDDTEIEDLYEQVAKTVEIDLPSLKLQLYTNFNEVFLK